MLKAAILLSLIAGVQPAAFSEFIPQRHEALGSLFDGGKGPLPLALPPAFEAQAKRKDRPEAPTVAFHGLELKTFLFSSQPPKIADSIKAAVSRTGKTLKLALYSITLPELAEALIAARDRGVEVRLILDWSHVFPKEAGWDQEAEEAELMRSPVIDRLIQAGLEIRVLRGLAKRGLMHNKFALFDGELLETGSFNWTTHANTLNYENALFRADPSLLAGFARYWDWMWEQAKPLDEARGFPEAMGLPPSEGSPSLAFKGEAWPAYLFSPQGGAEEKLARAIGLCRSRVEIAMFSFFSTKIAQALSEAKERGVAVRLVLESSQTRGSPAVEILEKSGVPFRLLSGLGQGGVLHHKFALFDGELLETGSYNYSLNAEFNSFENLVFSTSRADLAGFEAEFEELYSPGQASGSGESP